MKIPEALIHSLENVTGFDKDAFLKVHLSGEQNTSIRFNTNKITGSVDDYLKEVEKEAGSVTPVPWNTSGYYLSTRPSFTLDPLFHAGGYYVQEASSMFLEEVLKQCIDVSQPVKVLDLCAAPGGKSTLIQSVISAKSLLVSNEILKSRVTVLAENITKWGASNIIVTNNDPKDFNRLSNFFDVIVVDAPCSGSGLFRKDPKAIDEWSEQNVEMCSLRQQRILTDILPSLKPGGTLIYSTCSYSTKENEAICDWIISNHTLSTINLQLKNDWHITETNAVETNANGYRFFPDKLKGEGFFIAAFKKPLVEDEEKSGRKGKGKSERLTAAEIEVVRPFITNAEDFFFIKQQEDVIAVPIHLERDLADIQHALYIKKAGVKLGAIIRHELIPDHELALSNIVNPATPSIEVDKELALQYLRRQEFKLDSTIKGWALITYRSLPLGWVKLLSNRVNNYYPKEWRILNK